jgi:hypothetical protein
MMPSNREAREKIPDVRVTLTNQGTSQRVSKTLHFVIPSPLSTLTH